MSVKKMTLFLRNSATINVNLLSFSNYECLETVLKLSQTLNNYQLFSISLKFKFKNGTRDLEMLMLAIFNLMKDCEGL